MINWNQDPDFSTFGTTQGLAPWWTIQPSYGTGVTANGTDGWFAMYPFFITMGMIFAVAYSAWKFYRKGMSLSDLAIGVIFIVPLALFWASFFGKLEVKEPMTWSKFWELWAFWHQGMSIHGGVLGGIITGIIVFGIIGHYKKVSMWTYADAILPNVFLGQAVGRWGNFFNHELTGAPVGVVGTWDGKAATFNGNEFLTWLPKYIRTNTQFLYTGDGTDLDGKIFHAMDGEALKSGDIVQMNPIFFYEFLAFIILWFLITFVVPNIGKWFGPKPWKKMKSNFKLDWKQTFINIFEFWKLPTNAKLERITKDVYAKYETPSYKNQPAWSQSWFTIWKQAYEYQEMPAQKIEYNVTIDGYETLKISRNAKRRKDGKELLRANNPEGYWITKVGFEASAYLLTWNIVRFALEIQRSSDLLFIMNDKPLSLGLIAATGFIGLLGMIFTQTIFPIYFRQPGILYEKDFFQAKKINKHWGK